MAAREGQTLALMTGGGVGLDVVGQTQGSDTTCPSDHVTMVGNVRDRSWIGDKRSVVLDPNTKSLTSDMGENLE